VYGLIVLSTNPHRSEDMWQFTSAFHTPQTTKLRSARYDKSRFFGNLANPALGGDLKMYGV
jgi:hypothetical protein